MCSTPLPRRRELINVLSKGGVYAVGTLGLSQPKVSKHLGVLRKVELVSVRKEGQQRLYHLNTKELKPVHDWVKHFERFWTHQLDRIKERAERTARERKSDTPS